MAKWLHFKIERNPSRNTFVHFNALGAFWIRHIDYHNDIEVNDWFEFRCDERNVVA